MHAGDNVHLEREHAPGAGEPVVARGGAGCFFDGRSEPSPGGDEPIVVQLGHGVFVQCDGGVGPSEDAPFVAERRLGGLGQASADRSPGEGESGAVGLLRLRSVERCDRQAMPCRADSAVDRVLLESGNC